MIVPNPKILVIQRETPCLTLLRNCLTSWAFDVDATKDALQALDWVGERRYELVITDDRLHSFDSFRLVKQIKQFTQEKTGVSIPAFGINGSAFTDRTKELYNAGCSEVFCKPVTLKSLTEIRYLSYKSLFAHWWFSQNRSRNLT